MIIAKATYEFLDNPYSASGYLVITLPNKLATVYRKTPGLQYKPLISISREITCITEAQAAVEQYLDGSLFTLEPPNNINA